MRYPLELVPSATETIELPSSRMIAVPKATPTFKQWTGAPVAERYGNKCVLDYGDNPAFAELAILWAFLDAGWEGVWVDTYGKRFRTSFWPRNEVKLSPKQLALFEGIYDKAGLRRGCWDVFCWKENEVIFAESKRQGRDRIRNSQRIWLEAAISYGLPLESFLIVEWSTA